MEKKLKIEYVISGYDAFLKTGEATPGDALGRLATQTETIGGATTEKVYTYVSVRRNTSTDIATAEASCLAKGRTGHGTGKGGGRARSAA